MISSINTMLSERSNRYWLTAIILLSIFGRIIVALLLGNNIQELPGTYDQVSYDMLARQVLAGQGLTVADDWWPLTPAGEPTAHWSYLYTFYLVMVYGLFGYYPIVARVLQAVLTGLFMPWLAYRLGHRLFGSRVGLLSAGLAAFYIYFLYYSATLMTETFYIVSILWVLDVALQLENPKPTKPILQWLMLGIALATTVLLRQVFLLFVPFLFMWLLWRNYCQPGRAIGRTLLGLFVAGSCLMMAILPWTYRNYRAFDQIVLLNTNAGFAFYWGNHSIHGVNFISILPDDGPSYEELIPPELYSLNEAELDRALLSRAFATIAAEPGRYLLLSISRTKDFFRFWPSMESSLISNVSRIFSFGLLWPFMLYGLILGGRRLLSSGQLILYLFMIIYTGIHLLTWALIRYRLPVDAVLLIFAGLALVRIWDGLLERFNKISEVPTMKVQI